MTTITKNCAKLILFLGIRPEEKFFTKELSNRLKISLGGAHNALKYLIKKKIISEEKKGNMNFYQINDKNPVVKQVKITAAIEALMPLIDKTKGNAKEIILFGSTSRGEQTIGSDVDLFILTHQPEIVRQNISKYAKRMNIKAVIKTPNQWSEMELKKPEFYNEVKRGIKLF
jgi:predicted nucleotidyltransferase